MSEKKKSFQTIRDERYVAEGLAPVRELVLNEEGPVLDLPESSLAPLDPLDRSGEVSKKSAELGFKPYSTVKLEQIDIKGIEDELNNLRKELQGINIEIKSFLEKLRTENQRFFPRVATINSLHSSKAILEATAVDIRVKIQILEERLYTELTRNARRSEEWKEDLRFLEANRHDGDEEYGDEEFSNFKGTYLKSGEKLSSPRERVDK